MHTKIQVAQRKGGLRYTAQVADENNFYNVGTFDTRARAEIAGKIFIYWCMTMTEVNRQRIKNNYFPDAI